MDIIKTYDLLVIGAGSAGVRSSRLATNRGKKVALIEASKIGGTCVNRGCVPKKLMFYASSYAHDFLQSQGFGWSVSGEQEFNWNQFMVTKEKELARLESIYLKNITNAGVDLYHSSARFISPNEVKLSTGEIIKSENIIIATGSKAFIPKDLAGVEHCITTDEALTLPEKPESMLIYGAGYSAVEFANIFHGLGVKVTLVHARDLVLTRFDHDLRMKLNQAMIDKGIEIIPNTRVTKIEGTDNSKLVTLLDGSIKEYSKVLFCLGRVPNTSSLNLDVTGVELGSRGEIIVDEYQRTNIPNIYALGDVKGKVQLAPVAIAEAIAVIKSIYENKPNDLDYSSIPTAVFSQPELASVGCTEEVAALAYKRLDVYRIEFRPMKHTLSGDKERVFMKLLVNAEDDTVVGVHLFGSGSAELIQVLGVCVTAKVKKSDFDKTMAVHPTSAEELVLCYNPSYSYYNGERQNI